MAQHGSSSRSCDSSNKLDLSGMFKSVDLANDDSPSLSPILTKKPKNSIIHDDTGSLKSVDSSSSSIIPSSGDLPPFPWFAMDIGGTLTKLVYFEPTDLTDEELSGELTTLKTIRRYLTSNVAYGDTGHRDSHLELKDIHMGGRVGRVHFIRFPTSKMPVFMKMAKEKKFPSLAKWIFATGGGAYKFEEVFRSDMNLGLKKFDELTALIRGVHFLTRISAKECFYLENPKDSNCQKIFHDFHRNPYPYLIVNIGSGVSIISVRSSRSFKRVGGSSIGGGSFLGLCSLLTNSKTYEEAIDLASKGDFAKVDKLVSDIYGGDYVTPDGTVLPGSIPAASFGAMASTERRKKVEPCDLAASTLITITNNITSLAHLHAVLEKHDRVLFVGNFLRINSISLKLIAYGLDYWSDGKIKALFFEHEGYLGAVGSLRELLTLPMLRESPSREAEIEASEPESTNNTQF